MKHFQCVERQTEDNQTDLETLTMDGVYIQAKKKRNIMIIIGIIVISCVIVVGIYFLI